MVYYKFSHFFQYVHEEGLFTFFIGKRTYKLSCSSNDERALKNFFNRGIGTLFTKSIFLFLIKGSDKSPTALFDFFISTGIIFNLNHGGISDIMEWANIGYNPSLLHSNKLLNQSVISKLILKGQKKWNKNIITCQSGIILDFLKKRRTERTYAAHLYKEEDILYLFSCLYGNVRKEVFEGDQYIHKTTPSGGAFWPLEVYFFRFNKEDIFLQKYNGFDFDRGISLGCKYSLLEKILIKNESLDLKNASGLVVILGDIENMVKKYGAKTYQLSLLEGGHISQNFVLACEEKGYGTCEIGGVEERSVLKACGVETNHHIFINAILFGKKM